MGGVPTSASSSSCRTREGVTARRPRYLVIVTVTGRFLYVCSYNTLEHCGVLCMDELEVKLLYCCILSILHYYCCAVQELRQGMGIHPRMHFDGLAWPGRAAVSSAHFLQRLQ